jgi:hypothetical protein
VRGGRNVAVQRGAAPARWTRRTSRTLHAVAAPFSPRLSTQPLDRPSTLDATPRNLQRTTLS